MSLLEVRNLAIAYGTTCVFNRVLPNGVESMAAALAERKGLTLEHSRQWLRHVGLERVRHQRAGRERRAREGPHAGPAAAAGDGGGGHRRGVERDQHARAQSPHGTL